MIISACCEGKGHFTAATLSSESDARNHEVVTEAVKSNGGIIALQILHTGRYAYHFSPVSASPIKAPIGMTTPKVSSAQAKISLNKTISRVCRPPKFMELFEIS